MQIIAAPIVLLLALVPASAQVINGEGTYEGSSLHSPPPDVEAADPQAAGDRKRSPGEAGKGLRDERK